MDRKTAKMKNPAGNRSCRRGLSCSHPFRGCCTFQVAAHFTSQNVMTDVSFRAARIFCPIELFQPFPSRNIIRRVAALHHHNSEITPQYRNDPVFTLFSPISFWEKCDVETWYVWRSGPFADLGACNSGLGRRSDGTRRWRWWRAHRGWGGGGDKGGGGGR